MVGPVANTMIPKVCDVVLKRVGHWFRNKCNYKQILKWVEKSSCRLLQRLFKCFLPSVYLWKKLIEWNRNLAFVVLKCQIKEKIPQHSGYASFRKRRLQHLPAKWIRYISLRILQKLCKILPKKGGGRSRFNQPLNLSMCIYMFFLFEVVSGSLSSVNQCCWEGSGDIFTNIWQAKGILLTLWYL